MGVGSGHGGDNAKTGLPASGTGCLAWMKATNDSLRHFDFVGCLLENNHTDGFIDPGTVAWNPQQRTAAFVECPDVFPLGDKFVAMASLYNWHAGGYFVNSYFVGQIVDNKFQVESRGPLDYGQYYAARTGTGLVQSGDSRRVLFSATGWHNPPGWANPSTCKTQMHLVPRDLLIDHKGRLTFNPIPEIATLRKSKDPTRLVGSTSGLLINGSNAEIQMNCTGVPTAPGGVVAVDVLSASDNSVYVRIGYDYTQKQLFVDHSGGHGPDAHIKQTAPLQLDEVRQRGVA